MQIYYFKHEKSDSEYIMEIRELRPEERKATIFVYKGRNPFAQGVERYLYIDDQTHMDLSFFNEFALPIQENREALKQAFNYLFRGVL